MYASISDSWIKYYNSVNEIVIRKIANTVSLDIL